MEAGKDQSRLKTTVLCSCSKIPDRAQSFAFVHKL